MEKGRNARLPVTVKAGYAAAGGANSMIWTMFYLFFLFFLTDVVGIEPGMAGLIMMVGTLWDALLDPFVGAWSDRLSSRWGRRRSFRLFVAIPYGVISWLLCTDFGLSGRGSLIYFFSAGILFFTSFALLDVPYTALAAEMTTDYDERTGLIGYRMAFAQVSNIVASALPLILVGYFGALLGGQRGGWSVTAAIFGLSSVFLILTTWRVTRGYELFPEKTTVSPRDVFTAVVGNRPFLYTTVLFTTGVVALNIAASVMIYFMTYYMKFDENTSSLAFLVLFACTLVWIFPVTAVSNRWGKRAALIISIGLWALASGVGMMLVRPQDTIAFFLLIITASSAIIGRFMAGWAIIADCVEVDEFKSGQRREGIYYGVIYFVQKSSTAFAVWIVGLILSWIGYHPGGVQSDTCILGIRLLYCEATTLLLVISIVFTYLMPMTRNRHRALLEAIRKKKSGGTWDEDSIKDLL